MEPCRLCGQNKDFLDLLDIKDFNIIESVEFHCRITLDSSKLLPQCVCSSCYSFLAQIKSFSSKIEKVQQQFKSKLPVNEDSIENLMDIQHFDVKKEVLEEFFEDDIDLEFMEEPESKKFKKTEEDSESEDASKDSDPDFDPEHSLSIDKLTTTRTRKPPKCNETFEELFAHQLNYFHLMEVPEIYKNPDGSVKDEYAAENAISTWEGIEFTCHLCEIKHSNIFKHKSHLEIKHKWAKTTKNYSCENENCDLRFKYFNELLNHLLTHQSHLKFSCFLCSKFHWKFSSLHQHYKEHHKEESKEILICLVCGEIYKSTAEMKQHILRFHKQNNETVLGARLESICNKVPESARNIDGSITKEGLESVDSLRWQDFEVVCSKCNCKMKNFLQLAAHFKAKHPVASEKSENYKCPSCKDKWFGKICRFIKHISFTHHGHLKFCCLLCREFFWNFDALNSHYKFQHVSEFKLLMCMLCGVYASSPKDLRDHNKTHKAMEQRSKTLQKSVIGNDKIYEKYFKALIEQEDHQNCLEVSDDEKLEDGSLTEECINRLNLKNWSQLIEIDCAHCISTLKTPFEYKHHLRFIHTDVKNFEFTCKLCVFPKSCTKIHSFINHLAQNHEPSAYRSCQVCSKLFFSYLSLYHHYCNDHKTEKIMTFCLICGRIVGEPWMLSSHIAAEHENLETGTENQKCPDCDKVFPDLRTFNIHQKTHEKLKSPKCYICEVCAKTFTTKTAFKQHLEIHTPLESREMFTCDVCNNKFASKYRLKYHKKLHLTDRPYECTECTAAFKSKCVLVKHMYTHTGERNFPCNFCEKRFATKSDMMIHQRLHTGDYPYQCEKCGDKYPSWSNLSKHCNSRHGIDIRSEKSKKYREIKKLMGEAS